MNRSVERCVAGGLPDWAGDCVRAGRYRVAARFRRSVLLVDGGGRACFAVNRGIGCGPLNLTMEEIGRAHV